jgi:hypothetical protein
MRPGLTQWRYMASRSCLGLDHRSMAIPFPTSSNVDQVNTWPSWPLSPEWRSTQRPEALIELSRAAGVHFRIVTLEGLIGTTQYELFLKADIEAATAQMERALRRDNWLYSSCVKAWA